MSANDWLRTHAVGVGLGAVAVLALVAGALVPPPRPSADDPGADAWSLPPAGVLARTGEAEFTAVRTAPIWGAAAPGRAGGVKAQSWKLTGIIARPVPTALVSAAGARQVLPLKAGDPLPDGGVISGVLPGALAYTRDGCRYERALYTAAETPLGGTCPAPAPATPPSPNPVPKK